MEVWTTELLSKDIADYLKKKTDFENRDFSQELTVTLGDFIKHFHEKQEELTETNQSYEKLIQTLNDEISSINLELRQKNESLQDSIDKELSNINVKKRPRFFRKKSDSADVPNPLQTEIDALKAKQRQLQSSLDESIKAQKEKSTAIKKAQKKILQSSQNNSTHYISEVVKYASLSEYRYLSQLLLHSVPCKFLDCRISSVGKSENLAQNCKEFMAEVEQFFVSIVPISPVVCEQEIPNIESCSDLLSGLKSFQNNKQLNKGKFYFLTNEFLNEVANYACTHDKSDLADVALYVSTNYAPKYLSKVREFKRLYQLPPDEVRTLDNKYYQEKTLEELKRHNEIMEEEARLQREQAEQAAREQREQRELEIQRQQRAEREQRWQEQHEQIQAAAEEQRKRREAEKVREEQLRRARSACGTCAKRAGCRMYGEVYPCPAYEPRNYGPRR